MLTVTKLKNGGKNLLIFINIYTYNLYVYIVIFLNIMFKELRRLHVFFYVLYFLNIVLILLHASDY